jgi:2,3-bisphosphoglycerate-dependent phosphoglycerate mutase
MKPEPDHVLVLLRHGHSEWNLTERFTGWTDIALTQIGLDEAAAAGRKLAEAGFAFDEAHISVLQRSRQTLDALLGAMGVASLPVFESWRLNERHYGALQGMNKQEIFAAWGEAQSQKWWRGFMERPPPLEPDDPRHPHFDLLYQNLRPEDLPATESLQDCQRRTLPYWEETLLPRLRFGQRLLVISHGNTLRGLVMHLENIPADTIEHVEIPPGVPLIYRLEPDFTLKSREWLE